MNRASSTWLISCILLGSTLLSTVPSIPTARAHSTQPNLGRPLDGPETTVANLHQAIQNRDFDSLESFYCAEERIVAQQLIDLFDPEGESTSLLSTYLQIASGIYSLDMSQLYYETKYYDENLGRAVVAVTGNVILAASNGQAVAIPYRNFSFLGRDWFRLINENGQWKFCHNLEDVAASAPINSVERDGDGNSYMFNTNSYLDTGISINAGDRVTIRASGTIRFGLFAGSGGPRGIQFNPIYNYFVDLPHGHLMARVWRSGMQELDGWFPVGEGREVVVQTPGVLELAVNDNRPQDNAGSFRVEVTVDSAQN